MQLLFAQIERHRRVPHQLQSLKFWHISHWNYKPSRCQQLLSVYSFPHLSQWQCGIRPWWILSVNYHSNSLVLLQLDIWHSVRARHTQHPILIKLHKCNKRRVLDEVVYVALLSIWSHADWHQTNSQRIKHNVSTIFIWVSIQQVIQSHDDDASIYWASQQLHFYHDFQCIRQLWQLLYEHYRSLAQHLYYSFHYSGTSTDFLQHSTQHPTTHAYLANRSNLHWLQ